MMLFPLYGPGSNRGGGCRDEWRIAGALPSFWVGRTGQGRKGYHWRETSNIDLYVVMEYGVKIPDMAWEIQEKVKSGGNHDGFKRH